jgi:hypothetical protein
LLFSVTKTTLAHYSVGEHGKPRGKYASYINDNNIHMKLASNSLEQAMSLETRQT